MGRLILFTMLLLAGLPSVAQTSSNSQIRIERAQVTLLNLESMAKDVTNESERAIWDRRIDLAKKEVANAQRLAEIEARERFVARAQESHQDSAEALRLHIRTIEVDAARIAAASEELEKKIRKARDRRAEKAAEIASAAKGDEAAQSRADIDQAIRTIDVEISSLMLQRDALDLQSRLASETHRIEESLREDTLATTPTVRIILNRRRNVMEAGKAVEACLLREQQLQARRDGVAETLAIEQARFTQLDEEIATLSDLYRSVKASIFSFKKADTAQQERQQHVNEMLADARSQKSALAERIGFRKQQVLALESCVESAKTLRMLREAEHLHLKSEAGAAIQRFRERVELPVALVLALLLLNIVARHFVLPLFFKREQLLIARRATSYFMFLIITFVLAVSFLEDLKAIATLLGIVGAAIVIALQDLCSAFAGWFVIVAGRKVRVGDRVEIDGHRGDVVDIEILRTTLLELNAGLGVDEETGRVLTIPNSFIFKSQVLNFTRMHPYIWGKIDITVTYETPFREARDLLWRILNEESREQFEGAREAVAKAETRFGLPESHYAPKMYTIVADSGVLFSMLYVAHYKKVSATRTKIGTRILEEFEKDPRMQLAYPTTRQLQTDVPLPTLPQT